MRPATGSGAARAAEEQRAARELGAFARHERVQGAPRPARSRSASCAVHEHHAVLADCTDCELGLERRAELAHDHHVERRAQRLGHLVGDDDAAARQADDERMLGAQMLEGSGKLPAGVPAVAERRHAE